MSFRLNPIFITNQASTTNEDLLQKLGLTNLTKRETVDFYDTNKEWETTFLGSKDGCKILCNSELCYNAFEDNSPLLTLQDCEVAAIIWDESYSSFGFCLMRDGKLIRKVLTTDQDIVHDFGDPIAEELEINPDEVYWPEERAEIIEMEGEEALELRIKAEIICRATNRLAKRYLGAGIVELRDPVELIEYEAVIP